MAMQPQADVLSSISPDHPLQQLRPMQRCERGQSWTWDGVQFEVLHPSASDYERKLKPNALSCVLRISSAKASALLVGDIEAAQEKSLVDSDQALKADWLLVPHHGSATSSTQVFLDAVHPRVAIVQAGYRNRFGHPRPDVLQRYNDLGVVVVQTPRCGASTWHSDHPNLVQCERNQRQRYWQHVL
jgi:competence protein ComEC